MKPQDVHNLSEMRKKEQEPYHILSNKLVYIVMPILLGIKENCDEAV